MQFQCTCPQCGGAFPDHPRYCSRACVLEARRDRPRQSVEERFRRRVVETGPGPEDCWEWRGYAMPNGYGQITVRTAIGTTTVYAHRLAWELAYGAIPPGLFICHACDNPRCVRPSHLFLGTPYENQADMRRKGRNRTPTNFERTRRGEAHKNAKLSDALVREARRRYAAGGVTHATLAALFGVSRRAIGRAITGAGWKHVE